jgi:hypothetical protein
MSTNNSVASRLCPDTRKNIAIQAISKSEPIKTLSVKYGISRKFIYQQKNKAEEAIDVAFTTSDDDEEKILFHLPITKSWLSQMILGLVLICHSSYRGVVEIFRDLLGVSISVGTIHNRLEAAAEIAAQINESQDLSQIKVGLQDEIFQGSQPVLAGVDAESTYCYLLKGVENRDGETWGWHLLDVIEQGFNPDYTIADGALGLRAGQKAVMEKVPCHGDIFHVQHQCQAVVNSLEHQEMNATTRRQVLEKEMTVAKQKGKGNRISHKLTQARRQESEIMTLHQDVKTLIQWLNHDVLELAGLILKERQDLFDFIVTELGLREQLGGKKVRSLRKTLKNQRDDILAFASVLDNKLEHIAKKLNIPLYLVRQMCLLFRKPSTSTAYWQESNHLHQQLSGKFHSLYEAVQEAMKQTPRASSLVENLNSRLRNYFFLRKQLGHSYLNLLQFFLNHRQFLRSRCQDRVNMSPKQLMTGENHPHWLELLGFNRFQAA